MMVPLVVSIMLLLKIILLMWFLFVPGVDYAFGDDYDGDLGVVDVAAIEDDSVDIVPHDDALGDDSVKVEDAPTAGKTVY